MFCLTSLLYNTFFTASDKFAKFDIFVNLSISEGIPVSIMEAISAQIPVIATNVGGMSEIITNETNFLLPVNFRQTEFDKDVDYILTNMNII